MTSAFSFFSQETQLTLSLYFSGRILSSEFMELPDKKMWPIYYKTIARPICFEDIFVRTSFTTLTLCNLTMSCRGALGNMNIPPLPSLRRMWSSCLTTPSCSMPIIHPSGRMHNNFGCALLLPRYMCYFNLPHCLQATFKKLMADLPEPFALPQYAPPPTAVKIKLKVPKPQPDQSISARIPAQLAPAPALQSLTAPPTRISPAIAAATNAASASASAVHRKPTAVPSLPYMPAQALPNAPVTAPPKPLVAPAPVAPAQQQTTSYYTRPTGYVQPTPPAPSGSSSSTPGPAPVVAPAPAIQPSMSASPVPPPPTSHPLSAVAITIEPSNRRLELLEADGVRSWMVRLVRGEASLRITRIAFLPTPDEDESGEEDAMDVDEEEEEDEEDEAPKSGKGKAKRGRGRPPKKAQAKERPKENGVKVPPKKREPREVQVKVNGAVVQELVDDDGGYWVVKPTTGSTNVVEVGSKGGMVWKVYVQASP